ncbi:RNA-binding domain-containing protein [Leptolyngbya sp. PCC 6406]|uniref:RNA-binding domain-containing protein n=1 Tax=Leptolyngbya sp. PCC 6406 TaxID=1173264 RepID=UPI0002AC7E9A|nr:RNA-binding domain-containing protein [Leptolyngbya sp. PCC 6406]
MSPEHLLTLVESGENSRVEFKTTPVRNESLAKVIVAFANMKGGQVLVGVADDRTITGVEDIPAWMDKIIQICRNTITPSLIPDLTTVAHQGKKVLIITVDSGLHKPYKVKSSNRYYIRAGAVAIEPTQEELIRLLQEGAQFHFEISSLPGTELADLDPLKWGYYCRELRDLEDEPHPTRLLYNLQLMDAEGALTVVGNLFFGRQPSRTLPQAGLELNAFDGSDVTAPLLDSLTLTETIPESIQAGLAFVRRNSRHRPVFNADQTHRHDVPDYEPFVIRELLVNSFAHRDWSIFGQRIRLHLFRDRLELFSPGSLPNTLNLDRALAGVSYYRNPLIAQLLKDYGLMDRLGRGLPKVLKHYQEQGLPAPHFDNGSDFFGVALTNRDQLSLDYDRVRH